MESKNTSVTDEEKAFLFPKEYWAEGEAPENAVSIFKKNNNANGFLRKLIAFFSKKTKDSSIDSVFLENLEMYYNELYLLDPDMARFLIEEFILLRIDIDNHRNLTRDQVSLLLFTKLKRLSGVNLSGADLSGADLSGADLSGADLSGANLSSNPSSLRGVWLEKIASL